MFGALSEVPEDDWIPDTPAWTESEKLAREKESVGVYLSGHPLDSHRAVLKAWQRHTTTDLADMPDGQEIALAVVVTAVKEKVSKRGGRMAIISVEDLSGSVEVLVFNEVFERSAAFLHQPSLPLWLKGTVVQEDQGTKVVSQEIAPLERVLPRWPERLDLRLQAETVTTEKLLALKAVLSRHHGPIPAFLYFLVPQEPETVLELPADLALTPSAELAAEVNHLFGYPVLNSQK
jgi:DNA polymerase-3 subunit alpha